MTVKWLTLPGQAFQLLRLLVSVAVPPFYVYLLICVCVYDHEHFMTHVWKSEDNLWEVGSLFPPCW